MSIRYKFFFALSVLVVSAARGIFRFRESQGQEICRATVRTDR